MTKIIMKRVDDTGLLDGIRVAYQGDEALPQIHSVTGGTLEQMVQYTFDACRQEAERIGQKHYQVLLPDKTVIGYTTLIFTDPVRVLYSFGIGVKYRTREVVLGWLMTVDRRLGQHYITTLRYSNERAKRFFERNGFAVTKDEDHKIYILCRHKP